MADREDDGLIVFKVIVGIPLAFGLVWCNTSTRENYAREIEAKTGCHIEKDPRRGCTQIDLARYSRSPDFAWLCCVADGGAR